MTEGPEGQGMKSFMDMAAARARARREPTSDSEGLTEHTQLYQIPPKDELDTSLSEDTASKLEEILHGPQIQSLARKEDHLSRALRPVVEQTVRAALDRQSPAIAESLYPYIGRSVRRSIAESMKGLVDSVNATVEQTFTLQGLKWRIESNRTGRPVRDIILQQSVVYRVEEVFLIHHESGCLLEYVSIDPKKNGNQQQVTNRLLTIEQFILQTKGKDATSFTLDDLTIFVEQGPRAHLATVVRGIIPHEKQLEFAVTLEQIHQQFAGALVHFDENTEGLEGATHLLEGLFDIQQIDKDQKSSFNFTYFFLFLVLLGLVALTFFEIKRNQAWKAFSETLDREPGIQVIDLDRRWGRYHLNVLTDPDSRYKELLTDTPRGPSVIRHFDFAQNDDTMVLHRVQAAFPRVPKGNVVNLAVQEGIVQATGDATNRWIQEAKTVAKTIPGLRQFETSGLSNLDLEGCRITANKIEASQTRFVAGQVQEAPSDQSHWDQIAAFLMLLDQQTTQAGLVYDVSLYAVGSSHRTASDQVLSAARTSYARRELVARGADPERLTAKDVLPNRLRDRASDFDTSVLAIDFRPLDN